MAAEAHAQADGDRQALRADPVLEILEARVARLATVRAELARGDRVAFVLVLIPERLPIEESIRAAHQLADAGVTIGGVIVNRVLPEDAPGDYFRARKAQERLHLDDIERRLPSAHRVIVPQLESDVHGLASLERISACLLAESAPRR